MNNQMATIQGVPTRNVDIIEVQRDEAVLLLERLNNATCLEEFYAVQGESERLVERFANELKSLYGRRG